MLLLTQKTDLSEYIRCFNQNIRKCKLILSVGINEKKMKINADTCLSVLFCQPQLKTAQTKISACLSCITPDCKVGELSRVRFYG